MCEFANIVIHTSNMYMYMSFPTCGPNMVNWGKLILPIQWHMLASSLAYDKHSSFVWDSEKKTTFNTRLFYRSTLFGNGYVEYVLTQSDTRAKKEK